MVALPRSSSLTVASGLWAFDRWVPPLAFSSSSVIAITSPDLLRGFLLSEVDPSASALSTVPHLGQTAAAAGATVAHLGQSTPRAMSGRIQPHHG
jgi:hypothetical protein